MVDYNAKPKTMYEINPENPYGAIHLGSCLATVINSQDFLFGKIMETQKVLCDCGCGDHYNLCECGCGGLAEKRFIKGHHRRGKKGPMRGRKHSEATKRSMSVSRRGRKGKEHSEATKRILSDLNKGNKYSIGRIVSTETKLKISKSMKGKTAGEKSCHWKGGASREPYCLDWGRTIKEYIKERDNFSCQNPECWNNCNTLSVHHVNYNKKDCDPSNLITICKSCNARANHNRPYWQKLYMDIMKQRCLTPK